MVSPYEILEIDENASIDDIKKAYRARLKETHPDIGGSEKEFKLVKSAYEELKSSQGTESTPVEQQTTRTTHRQSGTSNNTDVFCSRCGSIIPNIQDAYYREKTDNIFCNDCMVRPNCITCDRKMALTIGQFADVNGEPVCRQCVRKAGQQPNQKSQHHKTKHAKSDSDSGTSLLDWTALGLALFVLFVILPLVGGLLGLLGLMDPLAKMFYSTPLSDMRAGLSIIAWVSLYILYRYFKK